MKSAEIWKYVHAERAALVETWAGLSPEQWAHESGCEGWSVQTVAGHLLAAAEQTPANFFKEFAQAGFKFPIFADRAARRFAALGPEELTRRLSLRTTTTNSPPGPTITWLGETIVHGDDIRRPLGLEHRPPDAALVAIADNYKGSNLLIGAKRRIEGLRLRATDVGWTTGDGPEVTGPLLGLVAAMTGRKAAHLALAGEGLTVIAARP